MRLWRERVARWAASGALASLVVVAISVVTTVTAHGHASATADPERPSSATPHSEAPEPTPVVTFVGDSWTAGFGSTDRQGYAAPAAVQAGWTPHVLGVDGTGYLQGAPTDSFAERIPAAAETDADVVVVQGSLNEQHSDLAALEPAARDTLSDLRSAVGPDTVILVIGASHTPGTDPATIDAINGAVEAAADAVDLRFVDPAAENWTDPADPTIWADGDHPNDAGYRLIADEVSQLLLETVPG